MFELPLEKILELTGITLPPTGSFPPPKKIKFEEIKGKVVNITNNEPIKGIQVSNVFFKIQLATEVMYISCISYVFYN